MSDTLDVQEVQGLVSIALSSYEEWAGGELQSQATALASEYSGCGAGTMEGYHTDMDADGIIWVCDDHEWLATAYHAPRSSRGLFSLTAMTAVRTPARPRRVCEFPEAWTADIADGDAEAAVWAWALAGRGVSGFWSAVTGAGAVSGYRAWKYDIKWAICSFF